MCDMQVVLATLNEAGQSMGIQAQERFVASTLVGSEAAVLFALARQECLGGDWGAALASQGFGHKVGEVVGGENVLVLFARSATDCEVLDSFAVSSNHQGVGRHGGVIAVVRCRNTRLCICGFHLDGNMRGTQARTSLLPACVAKAWTRVGHLDVALCVGDANCTIDPEKGCSDDIECLRLLAADMETLRSSVKKDDMAELSAETREMLQLHLSKFDTRAALMRVADGCPEVLAIDAAAWTHHVCSSADHSNGLDCGISEIKLVPMPPGSFPTYRLSDNRQSFDALVEYSGDPDREMQAIDPLMDASSSFVESAYFTDKKAGIIKKRGDMVRMNLGWVDRLWYGVCQGSSTQVSFEQGPARLVRASSGRAMDHSLMTWTASFKGDSV